MTSHVIYWTQLLVYIIRLDVVVQRKLIWEENAGAPLSHLYAYFWLLCLQKPGWISELQHIVKALQRETRRAIDATDMLQLPFPGWREAAEIRDYTKRVHKRRVWTSSLTNYSTAGENEIKTLVFPDLTDILYNVTLRKRVGKDSDKYQLVVYKSQDILNGTDIQVRRLEYYWHFSIFCVSFPNSSFPFGIEWVYFSMKHKSQVQIVSPGNFYSFERKRNRMTIYANQNYQYQVVWIQHLWWR